MMKSKRIGICIWGSLLAALIVAGALKIAWIWPIVAFAYVFDRLWTETELWTESDNDG